MTEKTLVEGIQIPKDISILPQGLANKVLFVDYDTTQLVFDVVGSYTSAMFSGPPVTVGGVGAKRFLNFKQDGPQISKKADLIRFHAGKYYRSFSSNTLYKGAEDQTVVLNDYSEDQGLPPFPNGSPNIAAQWNPDRIVDPPPGAPVTFTPAFSDSAELVAFQQKSNKGIFLPDLVKSDKNRKFSPFTIACQKHISRDVSATGVIQGSQHGQQYILLSLNTNFISAVSPIRGLDIEKDKEWKQYVLNEQDLPNPFTSDMKRINRLGLNSDVQHNDHPFVLNYATNKHALKDNDYGIKYLYANIESNYNFYMKKYEDALAIVNQNVEQYLPNAYILNDISNETNYEDISINTDYVELITLSGLGPGDFDLLELLQGVVGEYQAKQIIVEKHKENETKRPYLNHWSGVFANNINDLLNQISSDPAATPEIFLKSRNLVVPPQRLKEIKNIENESYTFPMSTKIEFSTDNNNTIIDALIKTKVWDNLLTDIINFNNGDDTYFAGNLKMKGFATQEIAAPALNENQLQELPSVSFENINPRTFNLYQWFFADGDDFFYDKFTTSKQNFVMLDMNYNNQESLSQYNYNNSLINHINLIALRAEILKLMKQNKRSYQDILNGKLCYNETLFYRVAKIDTASGETVQNFYFVNSSDVDTINYTDTQVFYNKNYQYKIYAVQAVFGTKYKYRNVYLAEDAKEVINQGKDQFGEYGDFQVPTSNYADLVDKLNSALGVDTPGSIKTAMIDVKLVDDLKIIEVPYYEHSPTAIIDDPPVPPGVELIPYKNTGDKILMFLTSETGEYDLDPITISTQDELELEEFRQKRGYSEGEKIRYATDDHIHKFEIFRLDRKPISYADFDGAKIVTLENQTTFVDDTITPNRKYYYTVRSIDNHGHVSNPSPIYELELVENLEAVYPVVNIFYIEDLEKEKISLSKKPVKEFSKYLYIEPAFTQKDLNYIGNIDLEEAGSASDIQPSLGYEDDSVFGQKFKIRLTSKKTGKRIDFNIDFSTNYDKTQIVDKNNELP